MRGDISQRQKNKTLAMEKNVQISKAVSTCTETFNKCPSAEQSGQQKHFPNLSLQRFVRLTESGDKVTGWMNY